MQITLLDYKTEKDKEDKGYISYDVLVQLDNAQQWQLKKRYSEFQKLHIALTKQFASAVPKFPPKVLMNFMPSKIKKRKVDLQVWLNGIVGNAGITNSIPFMEFFEIQLRSVGYAPQPQPQATGPSLSLNLGPLSVSLNAPPPTTHIQPQPMVMVQPNVTMSVQTPPPMVYETSMPSASISFNMGTTTSPPPQPGPSDYHMAQQMTGDMYAVNAQINQQMRNDVGNDPVAQGVLGMQQGMANMIQYGMQQAIHEEYNQQQQQHGYQAPPPQASANFQFSTSSSSTYTSSGPQIDFQMNMSHPEPTVTIQQNWSQPQQVDPSWSQPQPVQIAQFSSSQAMDASSFAAFLDSFKNQNFSSEKVDFIKMNFKNHYFTSDQGLQLMEVCSFSDESIAAAVELYPRLVDQTNFFKILDKVSFHSDKQKIKETLNL